MTALAVAPTPDAHARWADHALAASLARLDLRLAEVLARIDAAGAASASCDPYRGVFLTRDDAQAALGPRRDTDPWAVAATWAPGTIAVCPEGSPLFLVRERFGLSAIETDALLVACAPDLDLRYERLLGYVQDNAGWRRPTVATVARFLGMADPLRPGALACIEPTSRLFRLGLLALTAPDVGCAPSLLSQFVAADAQVVRFLRGGDSELSVPPSDNGWDPVDFRERHGRVHRTLLLAVAESRTFTLHVHAPIAGDRLAFGAQLALSVGLEALRVVLERGMDPARVAAAFRDAALRRALLHVELGDVAPEGDDAVLGRALRDAADRFAVPCVISGPSDLHGAPCLPPGTVPLALVADSAPQRERHWRTALSDAGLVADATDVRDVATRFELSRTQVADAVASVAAAWVAPGDDAAGAVARSLLFESARRRLRSADCRAVVRIAPGIDLGDLVLPEDVASQLDELCAQVRHRHLVLDDWGFGARRPRGQGQLALFAGASGTGKTSACEAIAGELELDLLRVDLSQVVSKYIGETEKNLDQAFDHARRSQAVLLFDEADALFSKRTSVGDAHDRYANIEVGYLLQKVEEYPGIAILTSNLQANLDPAFVRRIPFIVEFPFPDAPERLRLWRALLPGDAPLAGDVDLEHLAQRLPLAGGSIRNIAMRAAYRAAADGERVGMRHLLAAAKREFQKVGKGFPEAPSKAAAP